MQHDRHIVLRQHEILFDKVRAEPVRQRLGGEGVLGQVAARTAVGDDERPGVLPQQRPAGHERQKRPPAANQPAACT